MSKKHKRRGWFLPVYLSVVMVCVAGICIWLMQLNRMMTAYEASQPQHVAQAMLDSLAKGDYAQLVSLVDAQGEDASALEALAKAEFSGKALDYESAYAKDNEQRKYTLLADRQPVAELWLAQSGEAWLPASAQLLNRSFTEYEILAPDDSTVYADGRALSEADAIQTGIATDASGHLPKKVRVPTLTRYRVRRSLGEPAFRVVDKDGEEQQLVKGADGALVAQFNDDAALRKAQGKRAVEIAKAYGQFTIGRKSKKSFMSYILSGSTAYHFIYSYDARWYIKNSGYKFKNVKARQFYAYDKNCFSCTVSYDLVLKATNGKTETYPTSVTLYLYKKDGAYKIYDMVIGKQAQAVEPEVSPA